MTDQGIINKYAPSPFEWTQMDNLATSEGVVYNGITYSRRPGISKAEFETHLRAPGQKFLVGAFLSIARPTRESVSYNADSDHLDLRYRWVGSTGTVYHIDIMAKLSKADKEELNQHANLNKYNIEVNKRLEKLTRHPNYAQLHGQIMADLAKIMTAHNQQEIINLKTTIEEKFRLLEN
ncbi:MAG: hypothetical protein Q8L85_00220 [Alphaproteobacteria bacterium]|nr:hypothetical protein [Alphaproteobacteria bacterium]